jgi:hypothetical protein
MYLFGSKYRKYGNMDSEFFFSLIFLKKSILYFYFAVVRMKMAQIY